MRCIPMELPNGQRQIILRGDTGRLNVPVEFLESRFKTSQLFTTICQQDQFIKWVQLYSPHLNQHLRLDRIIIQDVDIVDHLIESIKLCAEITNIPENIQTQSSIIIENMTVAILIVLRVHQHSDESQQNDKNETRPREYVLFCKHTRPSIGLQDNPEIPEGQFDPKGYFIGSASTCLEKEGFRLHESQLTDMSSLALSSTKERTHSMGITLSPGVSNKRVRLYLYRETVESTVIKRFQLNKKITNVTIDIASLNDAWRVSSDSKTLAALFLFHELRYHLPRYTHPRPPKRSPQFITISSLEPNSNGVNLKVRVAGPLQTTVNGYRTDGRSLNDKHHILIGDHTGIVQLNLTSTQAEDLLLFENLSNTPLILRNISVDTTTDGLLCVLVSDFGKISIPTDDDDNMKLFDFEVNYHCNLSSNDRHTLLDTEELNCQDPSIYHISNDKNQRINGSVPNESFPRNNIDKRRMKQTRHGGRHIH